MEITKKQFAGIILTVISLASAGSYVYLQETGKYTNCSGGWIQREDGMYDCPTRNIEAQWCHHGSKEGPENIGYRCYLGIVIDMTTTTIPQNIPQNVVGGDFIMDVDGVHCFQKGNLRFRGLVVNENCVR